MAKRLKWGTIEYLEQLIKDYFEIEPLPSIAGLQHHLKISDECWKYYISERWRTHRKSDEEIEQILKDREEKDGEDIYEDWIELPISGVVNDRSGWEWDNVEDDSIKERVSASLKNAKRLIDIAIFKLGATAKNPAYFIFYEKAALGYRETTPEQSTAAQLQPTKITINILPQPPAPQQVIHPVQYQVIDSPPENGE